MNKAKELPLISVIMPVYNDEKYIAKAIESILQQTYKNFELIIILEYGSNDLCKEIIFSFTDERIIILENDYRLGLPESLNKGIDIAKGEYIARMDADDYSLRKRLEKQKYFLERHPDIDICGTNAVINGKRSFIIHPNHEQIRFFSFLYCPFIHPSVMWRRKTFMAMNLRYKSGVEAEDYEMWMRVLDQLKAANLLKPLIMYNVHANSKSEVAKAQLLGENTIIRREYWTRNKLMYDIPKTAKLFINDNHARLREWQILELVRSLSNFSGKKKWVRKTIVDLYMSQSLSIKCLYIEYTNKFLFMYQRKALSKLCIFLYCLMRVTRRKIRMKIIG